MLDAERSDRQRHDLGFSEPLLELARTGIDLVVVRPDDHGRARARDRGADGAGWKIRAHGFECRRARSAVGLVQLVVQRRDEEVAILRGDRCAEQRRARRRHRAGAVRDLLRQRRARVGSEHARLGDDRDRREGKRVRDARDASLPREADPSSERGSEVVRVTLEREPPRKQVLGVDRPGPGGGEAERDDRRAGAEPARARDPNRELEVEAARILEQRVRANAEMLVIGLAPFGDDELVPEIQRRRRAVEAGAEVRRRCRRAHAHRVRHANTSAIASTSTSTIGSAMRSTASGSLSPWPVTTTTTVPAAPTFCTAASPAALAGSQKMPSCSASKRQAPTISSSVSATTTPDARTAASASARWAGSTMRIAEASVSPRRAAAPARNRGMPASHSVKPRAYARVLPPPP